MSIATRITAICPRSRQFAQGLKGLPDSQLGVTICDWFHKQVSLPGATVTRAGVFVLRDGERSVDRGVPI